jgi:ketosteroid isomerase-like protein
MVDPTIGGQTTYNQYLRNESRRGQPVTGHLADVSDRAAVSVPAWVQSYYADVDAGNVPGVLQRLAPDVELQFGAREVATGRDAAARTLAEVHERFLTVSHEFRNVWEAGNTSICEFIATYRLHDESLLPMPTLAVLQRSGNQIASMRVYLDEGPLRARSEGGRP